MLGVIRSIAFSLNTGEVFSFRLVATARRPGMLMGSKCGVEPGDIFRLSSDGQLLLAWVRRRRLLSPETAGCNFPAQFECPMTIFVALLGDVDNR